MSPLKYIERASLPPVMLKKKMGPLNFFFETASFYVALAILEHTERYSPCLQGARIIGVHSYAQP